MNEDGDVAGLWHIGVTVEDIDRSLEFYGRALGLAIASDRIINDNWFFELVGVRADAARVVFLRIPNSESIVELIQYKGASAPKLRAAVNQPGSGHLCFYVHDLPETLRRLAKGGLIEPSQPSVSLTSGPNEGARAIYIRDPDGHVVELFQRPTRTV